MAVGGILRGLEGRLECGGVSGSAACTGCFSFVSEDTRRSGAGFWTAGGACIGCFPLVFRRGGFWGDGVPDPPFPWDSLPPGSCTGRRSFRRAGFPSPPVEPPVPAAPPLSESWIPLAALSSAGCEPRKPLAAAPERPWTTSTSRPVSRSQNPAAAGPGVSVGGARPFPAAAPPAGPPSERRPSDRRSPGQHSSRYASGPQPPSRRRY